MAKQRYLKVKGKPGLLMANPWALGANPPRYAGKRRDAALDGEQEHSERYRDVPEVLLQHVDILNAIADGDLELLGKCIASDAEEASELMKG